MGRLPAAGTVVAAVNDLRYEQRLISAEEFQEWLRRWGIGGGELAGHIRRTLLAAEEDGVAYEVDPEAGPTDDELFDAAWVAAVCTGAAIDFATRLAEEVAVHVALMGERGASPWQSQDELAALAAELTQYSERHTTDAALAAEVRSNLIEWTRIDCRQIGFGNETVAREAALCIVHDGRSIEDVARDAAVELRNRVVYVDDVDPALRGKFLAANPGDLLGPVRIGNEHAGSRAARAQGAVAADPSRRAQLARGNQPVGHRPRG
jgi:hypothetical protein